jgi:DNA-binding SARP family transcriptional activator
MARLSLRLLGDFEARLGSGPPLRLRARKTQALLAYLASSPGQTHSRDKLASLLWGDSSHSQARSQSDALHRLDVDDVESDLVNGACRAEAHRLLPLRG